MNPVDRLIVALDMPVDDAIGLIRRLRYQELRYQVGSFKLGVAAFLQPRGRELALTITGGLRANLMLDLKLYDSRDTVKRTMEIVEKLGATWVTVYADCVKHAVGFGPKVLAVRGLTDGNGGNWASPKHADGIVCGAIAAGVFRSGYDGLIVCPGIRPVGTELNNHREAASPNIAIRNGADYIVAGRPIYASANPVAAARAIIDEIEEAGAQQPG